MNNKKNQKPNIKNDPKSDIEMKEHDVDNKEEKPENQEIVDSKKKTELGFKAKRILDIGRCLFLRERGLDARLLCYCDVQLSPENYVISIV